MRAVDWDAVPQPVRAMAYLEMAAYWARQYGIGHQYGLSPALAGDTLGAIIMVESWFEHRSAVIGASGNLDVGIGQCSDYCRAALVRLAAAGRIDFAPATTEAYGNPLHASRAAALWFAIMLDEAQGDLELAVRAYYRGMPAARGGEGLEYLRNVLDKRERFVRNRAGTPAWRLVYRQLRSVASARGGAEDPCAARNQALEIHQRCAVHARETRDVQLEGQHGELQCAPARGLQPAEVVPGQGAAEVDAVDGPVSGGVNVCHGPDAGANGAPR
jgi:hypothetical protein